MPREGATLRDRLPPLERGACALRKSGRFAPTRPMTGKTLTALGSESQARRITVNDQRDRSIPHVAVFLDFENLALGIRNDKEKFRIDLVLDRLADKGKIIFKRAYSDWARYSTEKAALHDANVELIDIPKRGRSGKNSADIRMVVDALELCFTRPNISTYALLTGDSDFSPLVAKLSLSGKEIVGLGVRNSTSELLVNICDEFIYYDDIVDDARQTVEVVSSGKVKGNEGKLFQLMAAALESLNREDYDVIRGSMIKQRIKRKHPSFNERRYGFASFSDVLEAADEAGVVSLERDKRGGGYIVTDRSRMPLFGRKR